MSSLAGVVDLGSSAAEHLGETVTLVEGSTFCIANRTGDMLPSYAHGLFFEDARFLSHWEAFLNDKPVEPLSIVQTEAFSSSFVSRARPRAGRSESTIAVFRDRYLGRGLREETVIRNYAEEDTPFSLKLVIDADFLHVFDIRSDRSAVQGTLSRSVEDGELVIHHVDNELERGIRISFDQPFFTEQNALVFEGVIEPGGEWKMNSELRFVIGDETIESRDWSEEAKETIHPATRLMQWRQRVPVIATDARKLELAVNRGQEDLGTLRIFDPRLSSYPVVAAGSPWFMTLFGRDSLLTAWMSLIVDPELAIGTIDALARLQGTEVNPETLEEPGKILHELRRAPAKKLGFDVSTTYYGSVDSTPLFVMLLGELRRWGLAPNLVDRFLPHIDRAVEWIEKFGDTDGDGFVECVARSEHGIDFYPAWKDSPESIRYRNGEMASGPIALTEVQAYVYAAYNARKWFAREAGDEAVAAKYDAKAKALKKAFNRDFWMDEYGYFALGLDQDKKPIDALASNMGHCLWTGIVDREKAPHVARHLASAEMFSGWGVRTLASNMKGFNPIGYQTGSVWPHDSVICAAGLRRYGFIEEAQIIVDAVLDAALAQRGRLPELYSGFERTALPVPIAYPTSCSPQAWAAASPLLALRILLGFDPAVPQGHLHIAPELGTTVKHLRLERIPLNGTRIAVEVHNGEVEVEGLDPSIEIISTPRDAVSRA